MTEKVFTGEVKGPILHYVYNLLRANVMRDRKTMSLILIREETENLIFIQELKGRLQKKLRENDVLFVTNHPNEIGILLPHSAKEEASGFLRRLRDSCDFFSSDATAAIFQTAIIEVYHPDLSVDRALTICRSSMSKDTQTNGLHIVNAQSGLERPVVSVKVSILDGDRLFRELLLMAVERIDVPGIKLQVREFEDGLSLSQSKWANSWHPHLVVMSDVLPKKNGLDVLHELRTMPNEEKFTILMMTRRNSEEDMIYAYESGTDGYLLKPFNLRLFEAQVKRMLVGLWS